jgi:hypothetical protein
MDAMHLLNLLQWPAMAISVLAAWLVGSQSKRKRAWGFWTFLLSNVLWIAWGWHDKAWALMALQLCLGALNIRGVRKNEKARKESEDRSAGPMAQAG